MVVTPPAHPPKTGLPTGAENSSNSVAPFAVLGPPFFTPMLNCSDLPSCTAARAVELFVSDATLRSEELAEAFTVN